MKIKTSELLFFFILVLSACSGKDFLQQDPEVPDGGITTLLSEMQTMSGTMVWTGSEAMGVYGSKKGVNAQYQVERDYIGTSGAAKFYGPEVDGDLIAFFPYVSTGYACVAEGRVPVPGTQRYCSSAASQMEKHAVMVARGIEGRFSFRHHCGVVKFSVSADFSGKVKSLELSSQIDTLWGNLSIDGVRPLIADGGKDIELYGMNKPEDSFDAWFMLPEGSYTGLTLIIVTDEGNFSKPVKGSLPVYAGKESLTVVKDESYEYESSDFIVIEGRFDK